MSPSRPTIKLIKLDYKFTAYLASYGARVQLYI